MKYLLIAVLILTLPGCARMEAQKKVEGLESAINHYSFKLRWALYDQAVAYHINRDGETPKVDIDALEDIKVAEFNVKEIRINENVETEQTDALVIAELNYYLESYGIIKKLKLQQTWWYDDENKHWFTESEFPKFAVR